MEHTYENIHDFMDRYFNALGPFTRAPETIDKMRDYYAPGFMISHPSEEQDIESFLDMYRKGGFGETLTPKQVIIDDKQMRVGAYIQSTFNKHGTGELLREFEMLVQYLLVVDEGNSIKVKEIFFVVIPGTEKSFV